MYRLGVFITVLLLCSTAFCCSTFCLNDGQRVICGRNMDFQVGGGLIAVCPKGVSKTGWPAHSDASRSNPVEWTSRYASLTFSLVAREFPSSGINECGLVVNEMTLTETVYPAEDDRPALIPLQWIQYQLDNCGTVEEVLATDKVIRVAGWEAGENRGHHFLVSDKTGESAIIEFIDGKRVIHKGKSRFFHALTNNTFHDSNEYLAKYQGFGGDRPIQLSPASKNRFVCLVDRLQRYERVKNQVEAVNYAFETLGIVAQGNFTVWSIVFDATKQQVYYHTASNSRIRTIDAKKLFANVQNSRLISIDNNAKGDITDDFVDYTSARNLDYVMQLMAKYKNGETLSEEQMRLAKEIAKYPESFERLER